MKALKLNRSVRKHLLIGLLIGVWVVILLIVLAPFDASDLSFKLRLILLPPYGIITFIAYVMLIPLQTRILKVVGEWTYLLELIFVLIFSIISLIGCYAYYQSGILNGTYSFIGFTLEIYYPIFFVLLGILILFRWFIFTDTVFESNKITLTGENKKDILQIQLEDLICISSADNYVEISYLKNNKMKKKLLRTTLKNVQNELPQLLKVHRSHLVNPAHITEWKNSSALALTQMDVPVTKIYKEQIMATLSRP